MLETTVLVDIYRELQVNAYNALMPLTVNNPAVGVDIAQSMDQVMMPWESGEVRHDINYDKLYYDNIGKFTDDQKEEV